MFYEFGGLKVFSQLKHKVLLDSALRIHSPPALFPEGSTDTKCKIHDPSDTILQCQEKKKTEFFF